MARDFISLRKSAIFYFCMVIIVTKVYTVKIMFHVKHNKIALHEPKMGSTLNIIIETHYSGGGLQHYT